MHQLPAERARSILRKLRDLDCRLGYIDVTSDLRVRVAGCVAPDAPVESSLRYRVHVDGRGEHVLEIVWDAGMLELRLHAEGEDANGTESRRVPLLADPDGRASAPDIRARMHPESTDELEVERFLRRLVRAAFRPSG